MIVKRILLVVLLPILAVSTNWQPQQGKVETVQFKSALIGKTLPYSVVLPVDYDKTKTRYPVLYLLHGLFGHYTDWLSRTKLAEYAAQYRLIIVTPEGNDSWYVDSATAPNDKYEAYIITELIPDVDSRFRTIRDRDGRSVAGLSMGGYGALKFAVKYPGTFAFAASMSGALDPVVRSDTNPKFNWEAFRPSIMAAFGDAGNKTRSDNDVHQLYAKLSSDQISQFPYLYFDCGISDPWLGTNQDFARLLAERHIPHEYRQMPGNHNWQYWDQRVAEVLKLAAARMTQPR